jgi:hypothetical protein
VRRNLWRLGTPLLALAVSFVVVLIVGAASPKHKSPPSHPARHGVALMIMALVQRAVQVQPSHPTQPSHPSGTRSSSSHPPRHSQTKRRPGSKASSSSSRGGASIPGTTPSVGTTPPTSPTPRVLPGGSAWTVVDAATLRLIITGHLNADNSYTTHVRAGSYLVCLRPPGAWKSASADTRSLGSWICLPKQVGASPTTVTFRLAVLSAAASGGGP